MKKILISVLAYIIIMLIVNTTYAATGTVNIETARMREAPSADSSIIALVSMSEKVEVLEETGDWYKVTYNGKTGYISKNLLDVKEEVASNTTAEEQKSVTPENTVVENTTQETATQENTTGTTKQDDNELTENYCRKSCI